jgi:F0F1-type ATP synthase assembly protein I
MLNCHAGKADADVVKGNMRPLVLSIRIILGLLFGVLLSRVFFPASGVWLILLIASLLVVFAYIFEVLRKKDL